MSPTMASYKVLNTHQFKPDIRDAARYIHDKWGDESNFCYYENAILHSSSDGKTLPQFYLLTRNDLPIGCYGLIRNGSISLQDLSPWFCSLFIEPPHRGKDSQTFCLSMPKSKRKP